MAKFLRFQKKSLEGTVTSRRKKFGLSLSENRSHSLALDADRHSRRAVRVEAGRPRVAVTGEAVAVMGFHRGSRAVETISTVSRRTTVAKMIEALEGKAKEQAR